MCLADYIVPFREFYAPINFFRLFKITHIDYTFNSISSQQKIKIIKANNFLDFSAICVYNTLQTHKCRCDGIGRRAGLKIRSWRQGAGSTPATGTKKALAFAGAFLILITRVIFPTISCRPRGNWF